MLIGVAAERERERERGGGGECVRELLKVYVIVESYETVVVIHSRNR